MHCLQLHDDDFTSETKRSHTFNFLVGGRSSLLKIVSEEDGGKTVDREVSESKKCLRFRSVLGTIDARWLGGKILAGETTLPSACGLLQGTKKSEMLLVLLDSSSSNWFAWSDISVMKVSIDALIFKVFTKKDKITKTMSSNSSSYHTLSELETAFLIKPEASDASISDVQLVSAGIAQLFERCTLFDLSYPFTGEFEVFWTAETPTTNKRGIRPFSNTSASTRSKSSFDNSASQ